MKLDWAVEHGYAGLPDFRALLSIRAVLSAHLADPLFFAGNTGHFHNIKGDRLID